MIPALVAVLLTIVIEAALTPLVVRGERRRRVVVDGVFINLTTNPLAQLCVRGLGWPFLAVEIAVVTAEAILYRRISRLETAAAVRVSIVLNLVTAALSFAF